MSPFRNFWLSLALAVVCIATFAITYYALAEGKRIHPQDGYEWLFGSLLFIGGVAVVMLYSAMGGVEEKKKKTWFALGGGAVVAGTYFYLLMFVVLNTLGS